jgi:hypothetical protein
MAPNATNVVVLRTFLPRLDRFANGYGSTCPLFTPLGGGGSHFEGVRCLVQDTCQMVPLALQRRCHDHVSDAACGREACDLPVYLAEPMFVHLRRPVAATSSRPFSGKERDDSGSRRPPGIL